MILNDKHIDETIVCGLYGCENDGENLWINCYNDMDLVKGLKFSKRINLLNNKQTLGKTINTLTGEDLKPYPLGIHRCNANREVLYITSNEWDLFTIAQVKPLKYNVISVINRLDDYAAIINAFDFIHEFKKVVIISTANDNKWLYETHKRILKDGIEVLTVYMPLLEGCKSINDYFIQYGEEKTSAMLAGLLTDPVEIGVPGVVNIAKVKAEVKRNTRRYYTQLDIIDEKTGAMEGGQFWLLTGHTGNGKSELSMQMSLSVVQQGGKVFYYSGEETKEKFLNKLHCKVVDPNCIIKTPRPLYGGRVSSTAFDYSVDYRHAHEVNQWLDGKYYIYDEKYDSLNLIHNVIEMLKSMHIEKGVTAFFLDNLMTLTAGIKSIDLNAVQTDLTNALVTFAKDYNVFVLMVAHPNKSSGDDIQNKDVAGSFNVVNLAMVVMNVRRATKEEMEKAEVTGKMGLNAYITCTKNRPTGDTFKMWAIFDHKNKIFYRENRRPEFDWNKDTLFKTITVEQAQEEIYDF